MHLPHRESFGPDAAYHIGPRTGMRFLEGAPSLLWKSAAKMTTARPQNAMQEKRHDYFACGTLVVWDVDC